MKADKKDLKEIAHVINLELLDTKKYGNISAPSYLNSLINPY